MNIKEIEKLFLTEPDKLIKIGENAGKDFSETKTKIDKGKLLVKELYNITDNDIDAVEFVFWISYLAERSLRDLIVDTEVSQGARREAIIEIINKTHFGDKIGVAKKLYSEDESDKYYSLLRNINDLRNDVAHGRFDKLKYGGYNLYDVKGQLRVITDFINSHFKK